jgi:hypothetical protein
MSVGLSKLLAVATEHAAVLISLLLLSAGLLLFVSSRPGSDEPPLLEETIPFFSNAYQYITDLQSFTERARCAQAVTHVYAGSTVAAHVG